MKDLSRESEIGSEMEEQVNAEIREKIQTNFRNNVIPFREKVGKDRAIEKHIGNVDSRKFPGDVLAETISQLDDMYGAKNWQEGYDKLSDLRTQKQRMLSTMIAKAQNALGVGEVSKKVLALETEISNLASLLKRIPAAEEMKAITAEKNNQFSNETAASVEALKDENDDEDENEVEYKIAA